MTDYDWDQSDDSQYCEHGTFIGSWWGPDLLCGYCESGTTKEEFAAIVARQAHDAAVSMARSAVYDDVIRIACERKDSIRANPRQYSEWVLQLLDDITATDTESLRAFAS